MLPHCKDDEVRLSAALGTCLTIPQTKGCSEGPGDRTADLGTGPSCFGIDQEFFSTKWIINNGIDLPGEF